MVPSHTMLHVPFTFSCGGKGGAQVILYRALSPD